MQPHIWVQGVPQSPGPARAHAVGAGPRAAPMATHPKDHPYPKAPPGAGKGHAGTGRPHGSTLLNAGNEGTDTAPSPAAGSGGKEGGSAGPSLPFQPFLVLTPGRKPAPAPLPIPANAWMEPQYSQTPAQSQIPPFPLHPIDLGLSTASFGGC